MELISKFLILFFAYSYVDGGRVLELSDRFLDVSKEGIWFVKFYAPWCGHCKKLEPVWNQVAQSLHSTPVRVGRVDCTRFTSVANEYKVKGFPTLLFIKGDEVYTFMGDRTREEIVDFALRLAGPPITHLNKYEELLSAQKQHTVFFLYIGQPETEMKEIYNQIAQTFQPSSHFYSALPDCVEHEFKDERWPQIKVFKDGLSSTAETDESEDVNATLTEWVNKQRFVLFPKVTHGNFYQLLSTNKYIALAVLEENKVGKITAEMEKFKNMLTTVVVRNKDKYENLFQFGWLAHPEIANSIAMTILPIPCLLVVNSSTYQHFIPDDDPEQLTEEVIVNFFDRILNNSVYAYGGDTFFVRLYRTYFEAKTSLLDMWHGNPVLTAVLFGLPMGFLSLICYSICCSDILEASEDDEVQEQERKHAKKE